MIVINTVDVVVAVANKNKDIVKDHVVQNVNHIKRNQKAIITLLNNHQTIIINPNNIHLLHHTQTHQAH